MSPVAVVTRTSTAGSGTSVSFVENPTASPGVTSSTEAPPRTAGFRDRVRTTNSISAGAPGCGRTSSNRRPAVAPEPCRTAQSRNPFPDTSITSPSPENLKTLFEFVLRGFDGLGYKEHIDYEIMQSTNADWNNAVVRIN
ncbi:MAG: hypothetical protein V4773_29010, partial [Verrucomicrobiota bacterium]